MESLVFVTLAPLAATLMLVVGLVAWRRRGAPGGWALVAFSVAEIGWLVCDTLSTLASTHEMTLRLAQATLFFAPQLGVAWLAFVLSYTERFTRRSRLAVGALFVWCLVFGGLAVTNDAHRLVWSAWETVPDGSFLIALYTQGALGWLQTGVMWIAMVVSLGLVAWMYAGADARSRNLSRWIVTGALVPLGFNIVYLLGIGPVAKDFTPIIMAVSSAAFALGLVRYQLLDLRPIARATLVDDLREGMMVLDGDGRVVDANPALLEALGASVAVLGQPLGETAPALAYAITAAPEDTFAYSTDEATRYFDLRVSPLNDRLGYASGSLVLFYDVTSRREERMALQQANMDLYHANIELQARNDELDAFSHTVAHDLKNSIQGVMGWAEILRDEGPELTADTHHEIASDVVDTARKMGTVVHELLILAGVRKSAIEPGPVEMGAVVAEALDRLRGVHVLALDPATLPSHWPTALGHAPWVEEIWVNYLSNAAKYGGATVTLGAEVMASGDARFWVHDDGPGLAPEDKERLFVPFSRVSALSVEGHGLGLSIVRRITERLGGTCGVESGLGEGTRFWFALPCAPKPKGSGLFEEVMLIRPRTVEDSAGAPAA